LEGRLRSLAFNQQEDILYAAGPKNSVSAYAVETGEEVLKVIEHEGWIYGLAGPTEAILATADNRGKIIVWQLDANGDRVEIKRTMAEDDAVLSLALDPSARFLASGSRRGNVCIWDLNSGRPVLSTLIGGTGQGALKCEGMNITDAENLSVPKHDWLVGRGTRDDKLTKKGG
jgi:WD40 repeat protein